MPPIPRSTLSCARWKRRTSSRVRSSPGAGAHHALRALLAGRRATRRVYHVTDAGNQAVLEWMQTPLEYARVRDPAHLRAAYLEAASPETAREFFRRHQEQWEAELAQWEGELQRIAQVDNPMLVRRLAVTDPADRERTIAFKRFTYEGLVDRAHPEIAWARPGLALVDSLESPGGARPVPSAARS